MQRNLPSASVPVSSSSKNTVEEEFSQAACGETIPRTRNPTTGSIFSLSFETDSAYQPNTICSMASKWASTTGRKSAYCTRREHSQKSGHGVRTTIEQESFCTRRTDG